MSYFVLGQWNAICDGCGRKFKSGQLRKDWQGFMMCEKDWEPRHPQDFVRAAKPESVPAWTRPEPPPNYVNVTNPWIYPDGPPPISEIPVPTIPPLPTPLPTPTPAPLYTGATAGLAVSGRAVVGTP